jgi:hypothetical protein
MHTYIAAQAMLDKIDRKKIAVTQCNNRNAIRCTNLACKYQLVCEEEHDHTKQCVVSFDIRGTVHKHSLARNKTLCFYCNAAELAELEAGK